MVPLPSPLRRLPPFTLTAGTAQENDRAADLVEQVARKMWNRGEVMTLLGWLEALPEEVMRRRPQLLLQYSAALLWVGQLDDVEPLVLEIERGVGVSGEGPDEVLQSSADEPVRQVLLGGGDGGLRQDRRTRPRRGP